ncbi:MAG TPA: hypothetical protein VF331_21325 [Polyangiales bacterium]|jgi:hypothetical protein
MHRCETEQLINCLVCGAETSIDLDRSFALSEVTGLCFACAVARGGVYDALHDTWSKSPDLSAFPLGAWSA